MKSAVTFTILAGNRNCPNSCPICISKMTPYHQIEHEYIEPNWVAFRKAMDIALHYKAYIILISGKGEITLYPAQVTKYLLEMKDYPFGRIEIQTEGSTLLANPLYKEFLTVWKDLGLDVVAVSIYHYNSDLNSKAFQPRSGNHWNLEDLIDLIHDSGLKVRLSCVLMKDYIDNVSEVQNLIKYAKDKGVFQLTLRNVGVPNNPLNTIVSQYVEDHTIDTAMFESIYDYLERNGKLCDIHPYGARVYEVDGQNVCLTDCLTDDMGEDEIRSLIFFPQGWLTTSWENVEGGRIL